jgi:hypothetical protein
MGARSGRQCDRRIVNQKYVETPQGYIYGSVLQPTRNLPNTPITEMPAGMNGFWVEVTVPYVDLAHEGVVASPWLRDHITYIISRRVCIMVRWCGSTKSAM